MSRKPVVVVVALGIAGASCMVGRSFAEELVREVSWSQMEKEGKLGFGEALAPDAKTPHESLRVEAASGGTFTVLTLEPAGITGSRYAFLGRVRYEDVQGEGYLEMWNVFADGNQYFSRTVADSGPMGSLSGTSDWRPFVLPFYITEGNDRPVRLVVNVVLPGRGRVLLGPLQLVQYGPNEDPLGGGGGWNLEQTVGLLGGIAGSVLGCLGGLVGWLASRARARGFVIGTLKALLAAGVLAVVLGGVAVVRSFPYAVYYPLILLGTLSAVMSAYALPRVRQRYEETELRKMSALDAG